MPPAGGAGGKAVFRWPRVRLVMPLGFLMVGLGLVWLAAVVVLAVVGDGRARWAYAVLGVLTLLALAAAGLVLLRPPAVVVLDDAGYRIRNLRGGGVPSAAWTEVRQVTLQDSAAGQVLVLECRSGERSMLPLALLGGEQADALIRRVNRSMSLAHGIRPLGQ